MSQKESENMINLFKTYFGKRNIDVSIKESNFEFHFQFDLTSVKNLHNLSNILKTLKDINKDILIDYECEVDLWFPTLDVYFDRLDSDDEEDDDDDDEDDEDADQVGIYDGPEIRKSSKDYPVSDRYKGLITYKSKGGFALVGYEENIFDSTDDDSYWTKNLSNIKQYIKSNKVKYLFVTKRFTEFSEKQEKSGTDSNKVLLPNQCAFDTHMPHNTLFVLIEELGDSYAEKIYTIDNDEFNKYFVLSTERSEYTEYKSTHFKTEDEGIEFLESIGMTRL